MAFLDDVYLVSKTQEVREGYVSVERELWRHAKIRVHEGKTHIWNLAGIKPEICDVLQRAAELAKPGARVWRGSEVPAEEQGIKVLGTAFHGSLTCSRRGCCSFTVRQLEQTTSCESCDQSVFWSLPGLMTRTCGEDCAQSLKFPPLLVRGMPET